MAPTDSTQPDLVVLAMSGGVDSSVAAHLLVQQGFQVIGVFLRHGQDVAVCEGEAGTTSYGLPILDLCQASKQGCCTARDALDARRVADQLEIPFYALNLHEDFARIIDYFVDEYSSGRTPNPCVMCNNWVKFGRLFDYADSVGAHYVATGHYARRMMAAGGRGTMLCRGVDTDKDQSYVLFGVARDHLERMLLPVGAYRKREIRRLAAELGLRVADKPDSQEICFVEAGRHAEFVRRRRGDADRDGEIVTTDGRCVGRHAGIEGFTVGQRKGLGVALGEPYFVVEIQAAARRVVIGRRHELARRRLVARQVNWLVDPPDAPFDCWAQIRYTSPAWPARVSPLGNGGIRVDFADPCDGVAPGQAVVCYRQDQVLGGGWIESTEAV
jgi:tRNA-specific 2-thiouridylase